RAGRGREDASRALDRYELVGQAEQRFETLSGGQQARFQILLLELDGATLLLLDEPTDNLDLHSAEALEAGLAAFQGTVLAVTHDRGFARGLDRSLGVGAGGEVGEAPEPVWEVERVRRAREPPLSWWAGPSIRSCPSTPSRPWRTRARSSCGSRRWGSAGTSRAA